MWMEVHLCYVKAKSQARNMSQRYNDNTKRPKIMYLSKRMHLKRCHNFT